MIEIIVNKKVVDILPDLDILLNKEIISNFGENVRLASWSYEIEIPTSLNNNEIFHNINVLDVHNKFNQLYDAELYIDNVFVMQGKLMINEIDRENYHCNLFTEGKKELKDIFGDKMLNEIIPHEFVIAELMDIKNQNDALINKAIGLDNHICFPYILYRQPYNSDIPEDEVDDSYRYKQFMLSTGSVSDSNATHWNTLDVYTLPPSYNVLSIIKDCFKDMGYKLEGNIIDSEIFKNLYQTFSYDYDKYKLELFIPQYLKFHLNYDSLPNVSYPARRDATYDLQVIEELDNLHVGFSNILKANYKLAWSADSQLFSPLTITQIDNRYDMLTSSDITLRKVYDITINKSGWYQMNITNCRFRHPDASNSHIATYGADGQQMIDIGGTWGQFNSDSNSVPMEIQIKKTSAGSELNEVHYYSIYGFNPTTRASITEDSVDGIYDGRGLDAHFYQNVKLPSNRFPRNNATGIIRSNLLNFDTESIITLLRYGSFIYRDGKNYGTPIGNGWIYHNNCENAVLLNLPNPTGLNEFDRQTNYRYNSRADQIQDPSPYYSNNHRLILHKDTGYFNYQGSNVLNGENWDLSYSDLFSYPGQVNNTCSSGVYNSHNCVWLEKGESLEIQMLSGTTYDADEDDPWGGWEHRAEWLPNAHLDMDFEIYLVNSNEKWVPTSSDPIPSSSVGKTKVGTNFNQFLPSWKVNDFINGILKTFHCSLTNGSEPNAFSIDTLTKSNNDTYNLINIDEYANPINATMKKLDIPSEYRLQWKIDKEEIGYEEGNTNRYWDKPVIYPPAKYEGNQTYVNQANSSGDIIINESLWSFNWYKTISFIDKQLLTPEFLFKDVSVPIIMKKDDWNTPFINSVEKTNLTSRLFYLVDVPFTTILDNIYVRFFILSYPTGGIVYRLNMPIPHWSNKYILDYNTLNTEDNNTLSNLFNIKFNNNYQIDIDAILPIEEYSKVNLNTKVIFNESVYELSKIEGYSPNQFATWSLITE